MFYRSEKSVIIRWNMSRTQTSKTRILPSEKGCALTNRTRNEVILGELNVPSPSEYIGKNWTTRLLRQTDRTTADKLPRQVLFCKRNDLRESWGWEGLTLLTSSYHLTLWGEEEYYLIFDLYLLSVVLRVSAYSNTQHIIRLDAIEYLEFGLGGGFGWVDFIQKKTN